MSLECTGMIRSIYSLLIWFDKSYLQQIVQKFKFLYYNICKLKMYSVKVIVFIFTAIPHPCLHNCSCHFSLENRKNIFNCTDKKLKKLPDRIENETDWFEVKGNNFGKIIEGRSYLMDLTRLDVSSNNIVKIDKNMITEMTKNIKYLDISNNKLKYLPKEIKDTNNLTKLRISNNPYTCNCDMLWIRDWLIDAENVADKSHVKCHSGKLISKGNHIFLRRRLSNVKPSIKFTTDRF